jgi:hypothetical protein
MWQCVCVGGGPGAAAVALGRGASTVAPMSLSASTVAPKWQAAVSLGVGVYVGMCICNREGLQLEKSPRRTQLSQAHPTLPGAPNSRRTGA